MLIQLKDVKKIYNENKPNEVKALRGINFEIEKGDMCAIVGPSGSGKSTLLNIIGCIDKLSSGEYHLNAINIQSLSDQKLAQVRNRQIGFILQDFGLIGDRSVMENISVPLYFSKCAYRKITYKTTQVLEKLNIKDLAKRKVNQLSGGQQQRVAIARAIMMEPDIILADEPTGALDTNTANEMMSVLAELNSSGSTIIIVTHNPEISNCCKYRYSLTDGLIAPLD
jgi:putative ABC transport system ATP-binding protein